MSAPPRQEEARGVLDGGAAAATGRSDRPPLCEAGRQPKNIFPVFPGAPRAAGLRPPFARLTVLPPIPNHSGVDDNVRGL